MDPLPVVMVVAAHEGTFLATAEEEYPDWGALEMSEWRRESVTHIAFYRPNCPDGPAVTHFAPIVGDFYEMERHDTEPVEGRTYWGMDFGPLTELRRPVPFLGTDHDPRQGVRGRIYVTLESLLDARHTGELALARKEG